MSSLVEKVVGSSELARQIVNNLIESYEGDIESFLTFLVDEGITGWELYKFYDRCGSRLIYFVVNIDAIRADLSEDSTIIWPKTEFKGSLNDKAFKLLENYGINTLLSERLRWIFKNYKITQSDIVEEVGIARSTLSDWMAGGGTSRIFDLINLSDFLKSRLSNPDISVEWLTCTPVSSLGESIHSVLTAKLKRTPMSEEERNQIELF